MVIVRLIGGLGNQMFQYALGRTLALKLGVPLKLDVSGYRDYTLHGYALDRLNIVQDYAGGESYGDSAANYISMEPAGCR